MLGARVLPRAPSFRRRPSWGAEDAPRPVMLTLGSVTLGGRVRPGSKQRPESFLCFLGAWFSFWKLLGAVLFQQWGLFAVSNLVTLLSQIIHIKIKCSRVPTASGLSFHFPIPQSSLCLSEDMQFFSASRRMLPLRGPPNAVGQGRGGRLTD